MRNMTLAAFAFAVLVAFLGILLWKVFRIDLTIIVALAAGMAFYDFFLYRRGR
ncbi:hypothetical protein MRS76_12150 [Rhizobiaceae bacterium n13]|uniref:Uncharacterized protein n=1 Tax=Ferirhizobium litorale TaxID=2927786 RepID=A0AAE3QJ02_9HYPH|nr:hypothetical protein [Fererhizobium litorale]MDI7862711.1 hypothetical protein [Fererhizobium litorale]MDI7924425.1 hypothetical protein [Fererhizobium litorale]